MLELVEVSARMLKPETTRERIEAFVKTFILAYESKRVKGNTNNTADVKISPVCVSCLAAVGATGGGGAVRCIADGGRG